MTLNVKLFLVAACLPISCEALSLTKGSRGKAHVPLLSRNEVRRQKIDKMLPLPKRGSTLLAEAAHHPETLTVYDTLGQTLEELPLSEYAARFSPAKDLGEPDFSDHMDDIPEAEDDFEMVVDPTRNRVRNARPLSIKEREEAQTYAVEASTIGGLNRAGHPKACLIGCSAAAIAGGCVISSCVPPLAPAAAYGTKLITMGAMKGLAGGLIAGGLHPLLTPAFQGIREDREAGGLGCFQILRRAINGESWSADALETKVWGTRTLLAGAGGSVYAGFLPVASYMIGSSLFGAAGATAASVMVKTKLADWYDPHVANYARKTENFVPIVRQIAQKVLGAYTERTEANTLELGVSELFRSVLMGCVYKFVPYELEEYVGLGIMEVHDFFHIVDLGAAAYLNGAGEYVEDMQDMSLRAVTGFAMQLQETSAVLTKAIPDQPELNAALYEMGAVASKFLAATSKEVHSEADRVENVFAPIAAHWKIAQHELKQIKERLETHHHRVNLHDLEASVLGGTVASIGKEWKNATAMLEADFVSIQKEFDAFENWLESLRHKEHEQATPILTAWLKQYTVDEKNEDIHAQVASWFWNVQFAASTETLGTWCRKEPAAGEDMRWECTSFPEIMQGVFQQKIKQFFEVTKL